MMRIFLFFSLLLVLPFWGQAQLFPQLGAQRAGISGLSFLKIDVSPRSAALAGSNICLTGDAYSTYTNPANIANIEESSIGISNTFWVAGINHSFASATKPTKFGTFGLSVSSLNSGKMEVRTEFQPDGTGEYFYATNLAIGVSFAQKLTERFNYGVTVKYIHEQLAEFSANTGVLDLGFMYNTGVKDLKFAVLVQNFGLNSSLRGNFGDINPFSDNEPTLENYPAPTIFKLGVSIMPYQSKDEKHQLTTSAQLNHPNDNAENIRLGVEYAYNSLIFVRAGYKINVDDQNFPTAGIGLRTRIGKHPLMFDYSIDPLEYLGVIHRVGLAFYVNKETR